MSTEHGSWSAHTRSWTCHRPCSLLALIILLLWPLASAADAELLIRDDRGQDIILQAPAGRVVCLYGALTDMFLTMGRPDLLAGRTAADDQDPVLAALPSIGTHMRPNVERILALAPDLVLQMGSRSEVLEPVARLEELGITVAVFQPRSLAEIQSVLERIGLLCGAEQEAAMVADDMRSRVDRVRAALAAVPQADYPTVFFEIRYPNLLAAGSSSLVSEIIHLAGGVNCVTATERMARLGEEWLLASDPDVYLVQEGPMNPAPSRPEDRSLYSSLSAVRNHRVYFVDESLYSRPGPGMALAVESLFQLLHPELRLPDSQHPTERTDEVLQ